MPKFIVPFFLLIGLILTSCSEEPKSGDVKEVELEMNDESDLNRPKEDSNNESELENTTLSEWKHYYNQRYEFCVDYPSDLLTEQGESQNRDGNTFANANGSSEMSASGMNNALEQTIAESYKVAIAGGRYYDDERIITYKQQKGNWFVVSGNYNESIFYVRTVLKNDVFYTLYLEYHPSEKKRFEEIIARVGKSFPSC